MTNTTSTKPETALNIYQLVAKIREEAGALAPIQKQGINFPFRGIDGTVNHLSPLLTKYGVLTVPTVLESTVSEREDAKARVVKTAKVLTRFDFYAPDGTSFSATTAGLADDYADRATAQAQSVAYRIALLQTFSLPTQSPEPEQTGQTVEDGRTEQPSAPKKDDSVAAKLRAEIGAFIADNDNPYTADMVNELGDSVTGKERTAWFSSAMDLKKVVAALQSGVTA